MVALRLTTMRLCFCGGVLVLALLAALLDPGSAGARFDALVCVSTPSGGEMTFHASRDDRNEMAFGFRPGNNSIRGRDRGTDPATFTCFSDQPWHSVIIELRNRPDQVRLDAAFPALSDDNYKPLPKSIDVIVRGQRGDDRMIGRKGHDIFRGGSGADSIDAADADADLVKCGPGNDKAEVDRADTVRSCEDVS